MRQKHASRKSYGGTLKTDHGLPIRLCFILHCACSGRTTPRTPWKRSIGWIKTFLIAIFPLMPCCFPVKFWSAWVGWTMPRNASRNSWSFTLTIIWRDRPRSFSHVFNPLFSLARLWQLRAKNRKIWDYCPRKSLQINKRILQNEQKARVVKTYPLAAAFYI